MTHDGMTIGFIGLGNMGFPMAGNLVRKGYSLVAHDANEATTARFAAAHACQIAKTPGDVARACDILILMLPNGAIVRDVLLESRGNDGAPITLLRAGSVVMDMSSSDPLGTRQLGENLEKHGIGLVDAPVSGGVVRAEPGTLAVIVGGQADLVERMRPVLGAMASSIIHVGTLGAGHAMKALNNYVSAAGLLAACEAVAVAQRFGIDGETAVAALNASTGRNNSTENKMSRFVLSQAFNSGFSLSLMRKDLATALQLARDLHMTLPMAEDVIPIWEQADDTLGLGADHTEIARIIDSQN